MEVLTTFDVNTSQINTTIMTYTFYLAYPNKEVSPVMIAIRDKGKRMTVSTGVSISPKNWDNAGKKILKTEVDYKIKTAEIRDFESKVKEVLRRAEYENRDLLYVQSMLQEKPRQLSLVKQKGGDALEFFKYWAENSFGTHNATRFTRYAYRVFCEFAAGAKLTYDDIDYNLYIELISWMKKEKGYKPNMQGQIIKNLKAMMNEAYKREYHHNTKFREFVKPKEDVENIYLNMEELDRIYHLPLIGMAAKARDLFLLGCYTAMRFSDYSRLTHWDIDGDFLKKRTQKTGAVVTVPVHPRVREIIQKYNGAPKISQTLLNRYIKSVCQQAGIDEKIAVDTENGTVYYRKWEMVTSHTARRSGATNMFLAGIPTISIMRITGHTTEKVFLNYIKITNEENARRVADNPFFKGE
ncbi:MAG: site-specific integrase [Bacteroidales bacterium]|nr:site-specific integrase [Bacteroidales bacterium]